MGESTVEINTQNSSDFVAYLTQKNSDVQDICRLCLTIGEKSSMVYLFDEINFGNPCQKLQSLTSVKAMASEEFPCHICIQCLQNLEECYKFKLKCENSDLVLKSIFKGEYVKEEPLDTDFENSKEYKEDSSQLTKFERSVIQFNDKLILPKTSSKASRKRKTNTSVDFLFPGNYNNYEENNHDETIEDKTYRCSLCEKIFHKPKALHVHKKLSHSTDNIMICRHNGCKQTFVSERDFNLHSAIHSTNGVLACRECHKEFPTKAQLRRHINRHMENKKFKCDQCAKTFSELYAMRRHRRVHTGESLQKKYSCSICKSRFTSSSLLTTHVRRHTGEMPWSCPHCNKKFPSQRLLNSHKLVHDENKQYECRICSKKFRHKSTLIAHTRTHTGEKPYICSLCGKRFMQNSNLTLHMRSHTGDKPYSCNYCDSQFTSSSSLKTHIRTHTGEKPYNCKICDKRFARIDMTAHMRRHRGDRPFECSVCHKRFFTAYRLKEHYLMHTGEKPFECSSCEHKFTTKSHLLKHLKSHQKKKSKKENAKLLILHRVTDDTPYLVTNNSKENDEINFNTANEIPDENIEIQISEVPLEIKDLDSDETKTEMIVVENIHDDQDSICLNGNQVHFNDLNLGGNVNLVTMSEEEMSIASNMDGEVKLYQLDQSLVQIHTTGSQLTISKITSKMTANFE